MRVGVFLWTRFLVGPHSDLERSPFDQFIFYIFGEISKEVWEPWGFSHLILSICLDFLGGIPVFDGLTCSLSNCCLLAFLGPSCSHGSLLNSVPISLLCAFCSGFPLTKKVSRLCNLFSLADFLLLFLSFLLLYKGREIKIDLIKNWGYTCSLDFGYFITMSRGYFSKWRTIHVMGMG